MRDYWEAIRNTPEGTPALNNDVLLKWARIHAAQIHPDFARYQWEERDCSRSWSIKREGGRVQTFRVVFIPRITNAQGEKVLFAANMISVMVDSHTGQLDGFGYYPTQLIVNDLSPTVTWQEAEQFMAEQFFAMGVAKVTPVMSEPGKDSEILPDGLVIGEDDIGQQRPLWVFDVVWTEGMPGFESKWGSAQCPFGFWVAVDAHTGELYILDSYLGSSESPTSKQPNHPTTYEAKDSKNPSQVITPRVKQGEREVKLFGGVKVEGQEVWTTREVEVILADGQRVKCSLKDNYLSLSQIAKPLGVHLTWQGNEVFVVYPEWTGKPVKEQKPQEQQKTTGFATFFVLAIACSVVAYVAYTVCPTTRKKPMVTNLRP